MEKYPVLEVDLNKIRTNTEIVTNLCKDNGIEAAGIIKGFGGIVEAAKAMAEGGCTQMGSSRIEQLKSLKEANINVPLLLVRIPMFCELEEVVKYSEMCLVS